MTRVIEISEHGGPDVLRPAEVDLAPPGPGEVRLRQSAAGVNFHDIYVRTGLYQTLDLPGIPGLDGAGVVGAVGPGVTGFQPGDRVGYITNRYGGYAQARNLDADLAVKLPAGLSDAQAATTMMKAFTTCVLLTRVRQCRAGEVILVHAAAGGMGQLLTQWATHIGAHVIATVGSEAKAEIARACGARDVINYRAEDVAERVAEITGGEGVIAVYDAVGKDTFAGSMAALAPCGHMVLYGQASGPVAPVDPATLSAKSLTLSRPLLFHYIRTPQLRDAVAADTFAALAQGAFRPIDPAEFPLDQAADAHRLLEARNSPGGIVLIP